ncbi:MAG: hypothetical protein ACXVZX_06330, partial [Terriglobales bacterium]
VESIESHQVPMLVLRWGPEFLKGNGSPSDYLRPFRSYLVSNYHVTKSFSTGDEVWEGNSNPLPPNKLGTKYLNRRFLITKGTFARPSSYLKVGRIIAGRV